ncbi:MAG: metallophosphoesterase [Armatimonadetes bacterium]|nr:metallophosphoesterase [Armatimonadota bacterium]
MKDSEDCGCDRLICLGDLVDGGEEDGIVRYIRDHAIPTVRGNHETKE